MRRHIYKCGGTTIEKQTKKKNRSVNAPVFRNKPIRWVTFVRDPIDHFFSGFSECLARGAKKSYDPGFISREAKYKKLLGLDNRTEMTIRMNQEMPQHTSNATLIDPITAAEWNPRLRYWLFETKLLMAMNKTLGLCNIHSFPQTNFLFKGTYPEQTPYMMPITVIGDMNEMKPVLNLIPGDEFHFKDNVASGNNASLISAKERKIPSKSLLDWVDPDLLVDLCQFVAKDYFLFDFQPPKGCESVDFSFGHTVV